MVLLPLIQVHSLVDGSNFQRSLRNPNVASESKPAPPKSQKLPWASVQLTAPSRPPGILVLAAWSRVPYTPGEPVSGPKVPANVLFPPIHVHSFAWAMAAGDDRPSSRIAKRVRKADWGHRK